MKPSTNYEKFIADDFSLIQDCFEEQGYSITNATDFSTYQGWIDKGRKVKCGEKADCYRNNPRIRATNIP